MKSDEKPTNYAEIPYTHPPEKVLERFVVDLTEPIGIIEDSLPDLLQITAQNDGETTFSELGQALQMVNQNIQLVIDYLHSMAGNDGFDPENTATAILSKFAHELREISAPLGGNVAVCQQINLSKDRLKHHITYIEGSGISLAEVFRILENNWQAWLESGDFDWDYDDQVQAIDNFNKEPEQQASQDTVNLPEDRWRNAGLLDEPNNK